MRKFVLAIIVVISVIGITAISLAHASNTNKIASTQNSNSDLQQQYPNYTASIKVPENISDSNLSQLAKITPDQANLSALKAVGGGNVTSTYLECENGYLVYSVTVSKNNTLYEVKVDAGNGNVLFIEQGSDLSDEHSE